MIQPDPTSLHSVWCHVLTVEQPWSWLLILKGPWSDSDVRPHLRSCLPVPHDFVGSLPVVCIWSLTCSINVVSVLWPNIRFNFYHLCQTVLGLTGCCYQTSSFRCCFYTVITAADFSFINDFCARCGCRDLDSVGIKAISSVIVVTSVLWCAFMFVIVDNIMSLFVDLPKQADNVLVDIYNLLLVQPKTSLFLLRVVAAS